MARRTLVMSFDMETDLGSWTFETRGLVEGTPAILRILRAHRVPATFFFVGREAAGHPDCVQSVLADGHEVGCHTMFHETIGQPVYNVPVGGFILEHEIGPRLEMATEAVEKAAGVRPVSFRAPRLFGSGRMLAVLEGLGYLADSSFPAYFHGRDCRPYWPDADDWSREGGLRILEVPLFYDVAAQQAGPQNRGRDQWPMLRLRGAAWFADLVRRTFAAARDERGDSVLCVYQHPWEFVPMSPTVVTDESTITLGSFATERTGEAALRALDEFLGAMRDDGVEFVTLRTLAERRHADRAGA